VTCPPGHDPNAAGPTLRDYAAVTVTYEALHSYLIEGVRYLYDFPPSQEGGWANVDEADARSSGSCTC
jgi:hypothetical protein